MLTKPPLDQPVTSVVHTVVADVHGTDTLRAAATRLAANQVGMLVVRRGALAVGVLSERDIVTAVADGGDVDDIRVEDVMTEDLAGVQETASLRDAAVVMAANGIRHLLVRRDGRVTGVISARDVLAAMMGT